MRRKTSQEFELVLFLLYVIIFVANSIFIVFEYINPILSSVYLIFSVLLMFSLKKVNIKRKMLIFFVGFIVLGMYVLQINGSGSGNIIIIVFPMAAIIGLFTLSLSEYFYKRLNWLAFITWFMAVITSITFNANYMQRIIAGGDVEKFNPNMVAMTLGITFWFLFCFIQNDKIGKKLKRITLFFISTITFMGIYRCKSRGVLFALLCVVLLNTVFAKKIMKSRRMASILFWGIVIIGLIIPTIYTALWTNPLFSDLIVFGKKLYTGRQYIWLNFYEYLSGDTKAIIFGTGYKTIFYVKETFNLHNSYLQLIATFGIILFIGYIFFLSTCIKHAYHSQFISNRKKNFLMLCYFLLIVGYFETNLTYLLTVPFVALSFGLLGSQERGEIVNNAEINIKKNSS